MQISSTIDIGMLKKCFNFFKATCLNGVYCFVKTNNRVKQWQKNYINRPLPQEAIAIWIMVKFGIFDSCNQKRIQLASIIYAFFKSGNTYLSNSTSFAMTTGRRKLLLDLKHGRKYISWKVLKIVHNCE
jgi:hypothetical protein